MPAFKDLTNQTIGKLTVLKCLGKTEGRHYIWQCRCSCEDKNIVLVKSQYLCQALRGSENGTRSCGCLARVRKSMPVPLERQWERMEVDEVRIVLRLTTSEFHTQIYQLKTKRPEFRACAWKARTIANREIEVRRIR